LTFVWSTIDFLSYLENLVALSHISELHILLRKLSHTHALHELSLLLKNFYLQGNFCAYWLLTLNNILVYFWNVIWLFYQLFIHVCSEANIRNFFFLHICLCFSASSVKRPDGHLLASEHSRLCRSLIWQHAVWTSIYHVRTRAFCFLCQTHTHYFLPVLSCCVVCFLSDWSWDFGILCTFFSHSQVFPLTFLILLSFGSF
jgi:hypothetical protein